VLALAGTNFFTPKPAEALCVIQTPPPIYECQFVSIPFQVVCNVGGYTGPDKYRCTLGPGMKGDTPFPLGMYFVGSTLVGCPPEGSRGTYEFHFNTIEEKQPNGTGPWLPYGSGIKGVTLTIIQGAPGCVCPGTGGGGGGGGGGYYYAPPPPPSTYHLQV
jgi:hypothetical protein